MLKKIHWGILLLILPGMVIAKPFTDHGNGTVTDQKTGLIWQQATAIRRSWTSAMSYCEGLTHASKSDWRLPNIKELGSIVDLSKYNQAIDTTAFPGQSSNYWSSTTHVDRSSYAWYVSFRYGGIVSYSDKGGNSYVMCIRGGS